MCKYNFHSACVARQVKKEKARGADEAGSGKAATAKHLVVRVVRYLMSSSGVLALIGCSIVIENRRKYDALLRASQFGHAGSASRQAAFPSQT